MEVQDDMIVVIVGDEEDIVWDNDQDICSPKKIKEDSMENYDINDIMDTVQRYGRSIKIEKEPKEDKYDKFRDITLRRAVHNLKKEVLSEIEENEEHILPDHVNGKDDYGTDDSEGDDYVPDKNDEDSDEYKSDSGNEVEHKEAQRRSMVKPSLRKSFIEDLRQQYPELKKKEKSLIEAVAEIMRNIKPPKPPQDYIITKVMGYECRYCGSKSKCIPAAERHYQERHGTRYLVCFACGVDFRSKTNLYKHEKRCLAKDAVIVLKARALFLGRKGKSRPFIPKLSTPDGKPINTPRFVCSQCSATFMSKVHLVAHENCHRGVRPFCCDKCPNAYSSQTALTRHLRTHAEEQFFCDHCQRGFKVKATLVAHMNTHEPVPKFACKDCPKRFATKSAFNHHVRKQHLKLPMPCACQICPRRYPRMYLLREHMESKHGMKLMTRKMFYKKLPSMTEDQMKEAKDILNMKHPILNC